MLTSCNFCQAKYTVPDGAAGKQAKCAQCKKEFVVTALPPAVARRPSVASSAAAPAKKSNAPPAAKQLSPLSEAEVIAAFVGTLPKYPRRVSYRIGILLALAVMLILPLVYLGLICLVLVGVGYHAISNFNLVQSDTGLGRVLMLLLYATPIVSGVIIAWFLIKPMFAGPARRERSRSLTRKSEPLLFAFVDRVCDVVGAPRPQRIDVDCSVNAAAGFRRGMRSIFRQDLVLTIGLPLLAGLSVREFGGVLAHEFGHFAQGAGMRLTYLVRSVANWFMRLVYHRDSWDALLDAGHGLDIRLRLIVLLAQVGVLVSRYVLWALMWAGFLVAAFLLRQMEFDADRYEAGFAGSTTFSHVIRRMRWLNFALGRAQAQVLDRVNERRLVDDLIALMMCYANQISPEAMDAFDAQYGESKTGWFDSHPCDRERIAAAEALASPGIFQLDRPASELLSDFSAQCKATSWDLYLVAFGPKVPRSALQPIGEYLETTLRNQSAEVR